MYPLLATQLTDSEERRFDCFECGRQKDCLIIFKVFFRMPPHPFQTVSMGSFPDGDPADPPDFNQARKIIGRGGERRDSMIKKKTKTKHKK